MQNHHENKRNKTFKVETKSCLFKCYVAPNRGGYRQKVPCFTPNSFVMVNNKTFHLKHHLVFVKICPPNGQITFWPTPLKIEFSKLFYHRHVGCLSRGIEGTCSKITFFSYIALVVLEKSLKHNFFGDYFQNCGSKSNLAVWRANFHENYIVF